MGKITTEGSASRRTAPDRMIMTLCFFQSSIEVDRSISSAHEQCERFLAELQAAGFPLDQAVLQGDELSRTYDETPSFVTNRTIELCTATDLAFVSWVFGEIRRERYSATCSVRFEISDPESIRQELLAEAFRDARQKAELLVKLSGGTITGIHTIDGIGDVCPADRKTFRAAGRMFKSSPNPLSDSLEPGKIEQSQNLRVTWLFS